MTLTQPKIGYLPNQNLVTCNTEYKDKNINTEEERLKGNFEEESLKKGASLCDSHECDIKEDDFLSLDELNDFLSMNESDLDSEATKEVVKKEDKISDVIASSDHKNTQCPATDDEMDPFDDDEEDEESEREKAIKRVEKKKRFELARQKNKVSGLDPFDDSEDDYYLSPKKKQTQDDKKQKIKPKMYFAGGGMR